MALAVASNLFGHTGLALASVAMVAIIPLVNVFSVSVLARYAAPERPSIAAVVLTVVKNPLIWACAIGLAVNVMHLPLPKIWHDVADALGRSSLGIGLLVTGAGLHLEGLLRPSLAASIAVLTLSGSRTSTTMGRALPPAFSISSAAVKIVPGSFLCGSAVLAATTILAPSLAARSAMARPIPRLAPVMNRVFPRKLMVPPRFRHIRRLLARVHRRLGKVRT